MGQYGVRLRIVINSNVHPRILALPGYDRRIVLVVRSVRVSTCATSLEPGAYCAVVLSVRCEGGQQIPGVVCNAALRHHASPIGHMGVISKRQDTGSREDGREEGLGPGLGRVSGGPSVFSIPRQAVDEDDAEGGALADTFQRRMVGGYPLDSAVRVLGVAKQFDARRENLHFGWVIFPGFPKRQKPL